MEHEFKITEQSSCSEWIPTLMVQVEEICPIAGNYGIVTVTQEDEEHEPDCDYLTLNLILLFIGVL